MSLTIFDIIIMSFHFKAFSTSSYLNFLSNLKLSENTFFELNFFCTNLIYLDISNQSIHRSAISSFPYEKDIIYFFKCIYDQYR